MVRIIAMKNNELSMFVMNYNYKAEHLQEGLGSVALRINIVFGSRFDQLHIQWWWW